MSKRNRNKFRARENANQAVNNSSSSAVNIPQSSNSAAQASEYRIISADLVRLVVLNALMFALVLVIYFTNQKTQYLEKIFTQIFHF